MSYVYSFLFIVAFLVVTAIPIIIIANRKREKDLEKTFGERRELSARDFYEEYFESQEIPFFIVKKIREILEEVLDADLSRLSAEDDFSKNLNFFWQEDSLADEEIFEKIEEEFQIKLEQSDFDSLQTLSINDIVNTVWRKVREKDEFSN